MRALYQHQLYWVTTVFGYDVELQDGDANLFRVPFGAPTLVVEPTDEQIAEAPARRLGLADEVGGVVQPKPEDDRFIHWRPRR